MLRCSVTGAANKWDEVIYPGMKASVINTLIATQERSETRKVAYSETDNGLAIIIIIIIMPKPIISCGLRLGDEAARVDVGLQLGLSLCVPHQCQCGSLVNATGCYRWKFLGLISLRGLL